jgi:hypothetical protein
MPSKSTKIIGTRLPLSDAAWVKEEAARRDWTVSRFVARCVALVREKTDSESR